MGVQPLDAALRGRSRKLRRRSGRGFAVLLFRDPESARSSSGDEYSTARPSRRRAGELCRTTLSREGRVRRRRRVDRELAVLLVLVPERAF